MNKEQNEIAITCGQNGVFLYNGQTPEVNCHAVKCADDHHPVGSTEIEYLEKYTNATYFGYGSRKIYQCDEGYTTYNNDLRIDTVITASCLIDGSTTFTRNDNSSDASSRNCHPVKCADKILDNSYHYGTVTHGLTSGYLSFGAKKHRKCVAGYTIATGWVENDNCLFRHEIVPKNDLKYKYIK